MHRTKSYGPGGGRQVWPVPITFRHCSNPGCLCLNDVIASLPEPSMSQGKSVRAPQEGHRIKVWARERLLYQPMHDMSITAEVRIMRLHLTEIACHAALEKQVRIARDLQIVKTDVASHS